jgi:hypothetical protein
MPIRVFVVVLACILSVRLFAENSNGLKRESFDRDPHWEGFNNHVTPRRIPKVVQDFGYTNSNVAGNAPGEIGGTIWRSTTPASYATKIPAVTLADKISASGTFAVTATSGSSGVFFGLFNGDQMVGRQDTLGCRLSGQGSGARLSLNLVTAKNQSTGTKITPWIVDKTKARGEGRKFRPTSIKNDGTRYRWKLTYDPDANNGGGQIRFTISGNGPKSDTFEGKPFTVDLPKGYKEHGTVFDRFGIRNGEKGGNSMTVYFDDVEVNGRHEDFAVDPQWIGSGNRTKFEDRVQGGAHDYGFDPQSNHAGGKPGEIGGTMWRSGEYSYYADHVGPLTLNDRLEASGKVILMRAPPDSGMYLGWFNSAERKDGPTQTGNFLGVKIGGPTRVGHYFLPAYVTSQPPETHRRKRLTIEPSSGPVLVPQQTFDWKLIYDPSANNGQGAMTVALGTNTVTLPLRDGDKAQGATFDRFGLFTSHIGGSFVKIYFDDLAYTERGSSEK